MQRGNSVSTTISKKQQQQRLFLCHYPGWPGLAIFVLICSRHFSRSYTSSLLKPYHFTSFFTPSSHDFFGEPFFFFPIISRSITSRIWELMSWWMTWPYHRRWLWIIISSIFTTTPILLQGTLVYTLSTSLTPHIILIIWYSTQRNLTSSATVSSMFHNSTT